MMLERRFLTGFLAALVMLGAALAAAQWLLARVGEIGLAGVVERQLAAPNGTILFLSGVNQNSFHYKRMLFERQRPQAVAIGSSRALEVRSEFFAVPFVSMGGMVNNLDNLEAVARLVRDAPSRPRLALVFIDPWLFNPRYTDNQAPVPDYPRIVSADMLWNGAKMLRHGNWLEQSFTSPHLGMAALVAGEGSARDGSQYYNLTGSGIYDERFATTFGRIAGDRQNFQRNTRPDPALLRRICTAIGTIRDSAGHTVVVAPPFATPIWQRLSQPDYAYVREGYRRIAGCAGTPFFDFSNPAEIAGSSDCEFVDGLHGGDVTYARILRAIGEQDRGTREFLRGGFLDDFIARYRGHAGGMALARDQSLREVDFLKIGCSK